MSFKSVFFRTIFILFFLLIPLFFPTIISAEITPPPTVTPEITPIPEETIETSEPSGWEKFWNWLIGIFIKDYDIPLDTNNQKSNFTNYGHIDDDPNKNINSSENRSLSYNQQIYFKGQYIKDVINGIMDNKAIAKICNQKFYRYDQGVGSCKDFTIKHLAYYFVKDGQSFLYQDQNGKKEDLGQLTNKINVIETLPEPEFFKYKDIYLNFFRVPPEYSDAIQNQNATRTIRTPIPIKDQNEIPTNSTEIEKDIKIQQENLNKNFIPANKDWSGLNSLRPANW